MTLIKDFTTKLSGVAAEFAERANQLNPNKALPTALAARAQQLIDQRRLRRRFFPSELFHEPAWDMLLALFIAQHEGNVLNVKTLVGMADAPVTTSQRWIDYLGKLQLIDRIVDPVDRRRIEVSLSDTGLRAVEDYLEALD